MNLINGFQAKGTASPPPMPSGRDPFSRALMKSNAKAMMQRHYLPVLLSFIAAGVIGTVATRFLASFIGMMFEDSLEFVSNALSMLIALPVTLPLARGVYSFLIETRTMGTSQNKTLEGFKRSYKNGLVRMLAAGFVISVLPMLMMLVPLVLYIIAEENGNYDLSPFMALATVVGMIAWPVMAAVMRYKYFPVHYMIAQEPDIPIKQLFESAKAATKGVRAQIFILELTFVGWYLLGLLTCFIGALFIVPYHGLTMTEVYCYLKARYADMYGKVLCADSPTVKATTVPTAGFPKPTAQSTAKSKPDASSIGFPKQITPTVVSHKATAPTAAPKANTSSAGFPKEVTPVAPIAPTTPIAAMPVITPTSTAAPTAKNEIPKAAATKTATKAPTAAARDNLVVVEYPDRIPADSGETPAPSGIDTTQPTFGSADSYATAAVTKASTAAARDELIVVEYPDRIPADSGETPTPYGIDTAHPTFGSADTTATVNTLTRPHSFARPTLTRPELTNAADIKFPGDDTQQ